MKQQPDQTNKCASVSIQSQSINSDETTNGSSIMEFLNQEQKSFIASENDLASELDIDSIFEEINRLSDESDERSVDEILREAELLLSKQQQIGSDLNQNECANEVNDANNTNDADDVDDVDDTNETNELSESVQMYGKWHFNEHLDTISEKTTPQNTKSHSSDSRDDQTLQTIDDLETDRHKDRMRMSRTKIATPTKNATPKRKTEQIQDATITAAAAKSKSNIAINDSPVEPELPDNKYSESNAENTFHNDNINGMNTDLSSAYYRTNNSEFHDENGAMSLPILSKSRSSRSPSVATLVSPTVPIMSAMSASSSFSWTRERALEQQIESLRETLKDTEERLQSLRLQYDNASEMHRSMRDKNHQMQEEMDRLKIDARHLHDCANILRTELQAARKDRADALELQAVLQRDLERSQTERRRATEEVESNGRQIMDLQRQCKEMERILARKNPDAMQMLLGAGSKKSNEEQTQLVAARRQLEQRIAQLESDAKEQDRKAQLILANVQSRFSSVQSKYETHISDLETQVLSLQQINQILHEKIESQAKQQQQLKSANNNYLINQQSCGTQTVSFVDKTSSSMASVCTQTDFKSPTASPVTKATPAKKPTKQTVPTKEDTHLMATVRGMRVDLAIKEKALQRLTRELDECKKTIKKLQKENDNNRADKTVKKPYDAAQFTDTASSPNATQLQEKIKLLELDYKTLHDKRLQDLKMLQSAHERELTANKETVRLLEQRLAERDEAFAIIQKHNKVPIDYFALKAKVASLERRHTDREQRLHILVEALSKGRLTGSFDQCMSEGT